MQFHRGICNICGNPARFFYSDPHLYREFLVCDGCLSPSRYRSIAHGVLRAVHELTGIEAPSLAALASMKYNGLLRVYDTQTPFYLPTLAYPVPDYLSRCSWIDVQMSAYRPNLPWGSRLDRRTTNQNIEALTFPDASFDVLITSDVMEHVRLEADAHREIRRVLRPGGVYLFTVPHMRNGRTLVRVEVVDPSDPAKDRFLLEPEYHGNINSKDGRALSYRVYGTDLDEFLKGLGFRVAYTRADLPDLGILKTELFYCRAIGSSEPSGDPVDFSPRLP